MRKILQVVLESFGKNYRLAPELPLSFLFGVVLERSLWLAVGLLRFWRPVFVSPRARVRNAGNLRLGMFSTLSPRCDIDGYAVGPVSIGERTKIGPYVIVSCTSHMSCLGVGITIGRDCGFAEYCYFGAAGGITIGDDVIVGQYVSFHSQNHNFSDPDVLIRNQGVTSHGIVIGNNVWIGAKATFLDGARVGDGSVVAAGAVVGGQHPPGVVLAGIPARVVRLRTGNARP